MKLKSLIMFSTAALAFAACSNDEEGFNGASEIEGLANISVRISEPAMSRAIPVGDYTTTREVTLNSIRLVLTAQTGSAEQTFNLSDYQDDPEETPNRQTAREKLLAAVAAYQFEGVRNPSQMDVFINDADGEWTQTDIINVGLAEPLHDSAPASEFINVGDPDSDGITEYKVDLAPEHTMARLEFGGIKHVDGENDCMFAEITIDGVILDEVAGIAQVEAWDPANPMASTPIDAAFELYNEGTQAPVWPANNQCYAYNILPVTSGTLPILKVCFSDIKIDTSNPDYAGTIWPEDGFGYATVAHYRLDKASAAYNEAFGVGADGYITKFPAGYIYQVKDLSIPDKAIGEGWGGAEDVHIYATITVQPWTIVTGSVEWN